MREQELCAAVLRRAYESESQPGLLEVLGGFEQVRREQGLDQQAKEAVQAYRRLMRWGRQGKQDWWSCYAAEFHSFCSLPVQSLSFSDIIRALVSPTSFHPQQPSEFSAESTKYRRNRDFTPTKETCGPRFAFPSPPLQPFLLRTQKAGDADSISALYRVK